jgi:hypothetical protein
MLKSRKHLPTYNDGIAEIYREKDIKTSFGAKINADSIDDLDLVVCLAYSAQMIREQDYDFAERHGFAVSLKIKTHLYRGVDAGCRAIVDGLIYDVSHVDRTQSEMYLYLEGGEPFGAASR